MLQYSKEEHLIGLNLYSNLFDENDLVIADGSVENNATDYLDKLSQNYGYVMVNAHGLPNMHEHNVTAQRIPQTNSVFMLLKSCSVGNYSEKNAIAPTYLSKGLLLVDSYSIPILSNSRLRSSGVNYLLENGLTYADATSLMSEPYPNILFGDPTLRLVYEPIGVTGPKLKIITPFNDINLTAGETTTSILIENSGTSDLIFFPQVMYSASSDKVARIDASISGGTSIRPNEGISIPFFIESDFNNRGEAIAQVRFITNDHSNPMSAPVTITIQRD